MDSSMDADAVINESFARAFAEKTRVSYDGQRPFQNYLFSIAKNLVLREFHRRDRLVQVDQTEETTDAFFHHARSATSEAPDDGPERTVANEELMEITQRFIETLTPEEERFFTLRFARGKTQEATAAKMKTTRARVKLLEKNLRRRFLKALRNNGYFVDYTPKSRWRRQGKEGENAA
jgi:RNA polymerase sigma factor (sigma-70 family)